MRLVYGRLKYFYEDNMDTLYIVAIILLIQRFGGILTYANLDIILIFPVIAVIVILMRVIRRSKVIRSQSLTGENKMLYNAVLTKIL